MNLQEQHERYALYLLGRSREYVADSLEAHEHSDGRELLTEIDAALAIDARSGETAKPVRSEGRKRGGKAATPKGS